MKENEPLVFTVKETARMLRIGLGLAYESIRQGIIPSIRIGGRILVPGRALDELIASGTLGNSPQTGVKNLAK